MPSKSAAQARLMAAVAHSPEFAKKVGIPVSVGRDFNQADKGRKFKEGGATMSKGKAPFFGKESAKEERAEKKMGKAAYMRGERSEGERFAFGGGMPARPAGYGVARPPVSQPASASKPMPTGFARYASNPPDNTPAPQPQLTPYEAAKLQRNPGLTLAQIRTPAASNAALAAAQQASMNAAASPGMKCGGKVKKYARGGGIEAKGKTKGKFI